MSAVLLRRVTSLAAAAVLVTAAGCSRHDDGRAGEPAAPASGAPRTEAPLTGAALPPGAPGVSGPLSHPQAASDADRAALLAEQASRSPRAEPHRDAAGRLVVQPFGDRSLLMLDGAPVRADGTATTASSPRVFWVSSPGGRVLVQPPPGGRVPREGQRVTVLGAAVDPGGDPDHPLPRLSAVDTRLLQAQHVYIRATSITGASG